MPDTLKERIDGKRCPLCGQGAEVEYIPDFYFVNCPRCGRFLITTMNLLTIADEEKELLPYLSMHTRQAHERGERVELNASHWKNFALAHKNTPVSRKLLNLLELVAQRTKNPGHEIVLNPNTDPPLLDAFDAAELKFLISTQAEQGNIRVDRGYSVLLTAKGWEKIQAASLSGIPGKCFVAMSFADDLKQPVFEEGIEPAIEIDCQMKAVRIDLVPHNDNIIDKIIAEIRTCQFMVADFTGHKAGVYFDAGFAKGLGREVIWTCREDDFENIHFDIAQFSHIIWKNSSDLRTRLANRIKATIPGAT
jgi:hypothetical protein